MLTTKLNIKSPGRFMKSGIAIALTAALSASALAGTTDSSVPFSGVVLDTCGLVVNTAGSLGVSNTATTLSSEETGSGGISAVAAVTTNSGSSTIQVIPPAAFDVAPAGSDANTTFATNYALVGATNASAADGNTATALNAGASVMTINASATKSTGSYGAGIYTLVTTLRCVSP